MKKIKKGNFGYINYQRKVSLLITIGMFSLSLGIFTIGYMETHTRNNLFTVIAVLGCLPACKCAVNAIMFWKAKGCSISLHQKIEKVIGRLEGYYDLYFTSENQNFPISHLVINNHSIIAIIENSKIPERDFEKHLTSLLNKENITDVTIKLFNDEEKYLKRLQELNASSVEQKIRNDIVSLLFMVSL